MAEKIEWTETVDEYELRVISEDKYVNTVWFAQAVQETPDGGLVQVWGTQYLRSEGEAREAIRNTWKV